jgi:hypothetical protein
MERHEQRAKRHLWWATFPAVPDKRRIIRFHKSGEAREQTKAKEGSGVAREKERIIAFLL